MKVEILVKVDGEEKSRVCFSIDKTLTKEVSDRIACVFIGEMHKGFGNAVVEVSGRDY